MAYTWWIHPDNVPWLEGAMAEINAGHGGVGLVDGAPPWIVDGSRIVAGEIVRISLAVPRRASHTQWRPPVDRFVEYESTDEAWCRYFGIGTLVTIDDGPAVYRIKDYNPFEFIWKQMAMVINAG